MRYAVCRRHNRRRQRYVAAGDRENGSRRELAVRRRDLGCRQGARRDDEIALRIGDDMTLAAINLLTSVRAARTAAFRGFHRLAVDYSRRRARLASSFFADRHHQRVIDRSEHAVMRPAIEIPLHARTRRKLLRQGTPLAAGGGHIKDRIDHLAQNRRARGRPIRARGGKSGAINVHSPSVASLA